MVAGSFSDESVTPVAASRLWKANVQDGSVLIPKLMPEVIASIEVLHGDGGVGTVKKFNFTNVMKDFSYATDKLVEVDHEKRTFKIEVLEGGWIGVRLKSYSFTVTLDSTSEGGCKVKLLVEYDTLNDTPLSVEEAKGLKEGILGMHKALEGHLLANPNAYV